MEMTGARNLVSKIGTRLWDIISGNSQRVEIEALLDDGGLRPKKRRETSGDLDDEDDDD